MAEASHQCVGNCEIPDAGVGIDVGRRAAHDALDYLEPRPLPECDLPPDKIELAPRWPAGHVDIAAKARRMDRSAKHGFDGRAAFRGAQIASRVLARLCLDGKRVARLVEPGAQPSEAFVTHQHQIALLGLMPWRGRIESGGPVLDGVEAIPRQGLRHGKRCAREGLWRKSLHRIAVDGLDLWTCIAHAAFVSCSTAAWLGGTRKSPIASTAAIDKLPHS